MAMTYVTGKNTYTTMRELEEFINSFKLPNIRIMASPLTDDITIFNTDYNTSQRITRYALEDAADPKVIILEAISNLMAVPLDQLGDIIKDAMNPKPAPISGVVYTTNSTGPIWVSGGGGGAGALGAPYIDPFSFSESYNMDGTVMGDNIEAKKNDVLRSTLFDSTERKVIETAKNHVKHMWKNMRTITESNAIRYDRGFNLDRIVIAGGCFVSLLDGSSVNDFDVFLLSDGHNRELLKKLADECTEFRPEEVRIGNSNYMNNEHIEQTLMFKNSKFQYITTDYKTREELVKHFDFKHCCISYDFSTDKLYITRETYDLIKQKMLIPNNSKKTPAGWRYEKFLNRGWRKPEISFI